MAEEVLTAENLCFTYDESVEGISEVSFKVCEGEVIVLTGNSGCGKSTLLKCINGLIPSVTEGDVKGSISVEGKDYSALKMHQLNEKIGSVFQNPRSQFFTDNTTAELVFPMENYGFTKTEMDERLAELSKQFGLDGLLDRNVYSLSSGERQMIALASSMTMHQKILLFDEPSANLDYGNSMKLGRLIGRLKNEGYSVMVADHRFYYLRGIIDRVLFMDKGKLSVFGSEEEFNNSGYDARSMDIFSINIPFEASGAPGKEIAKLTGVSYKDILKNVDLSLNEGEITVLVGDNGAGKTTLAKIMCKSIKPDEGRVWTDGLPFFIMQDPDFQLFGTSVFNELSMVKDDKEEIRRVTEHLGLYSYGNKHPFDLSGGQKQRLQIGMAMLCGRKFIIFDEPTSGLDVSSMLKVSDEIQRLRAGAGVLVISHDYEFIRHVADRILFLEDGNITKDFRSNENTLIDLNNIFVKMQEDKNA